jgi:hypothetical protein
MVATLTWGGWSGEEAWKAGMEGGRSKPKVELERKRGAIPNYNLGDRAEGINPRDIIFPDRGIKIVMPPPGP